MIIQLNPRIPMMTPKGPGEAVIFKDPGPDHDDQWIVLLRNNELWTFKNSEVRGIENVTEQRAQKLDRNTLRDNYLLDLNLCRQAAGLSWYNAMDLLKWESMK